MHINELPPEIFSKITSYLTVEEKFRNERVCHYWQDNVLTSVRNLAFEKFDDVICAHPKHQICKDDLLPSKVNDDDQAMKRIISKCGKHLISFKGFVSHASMAMISKTCLRLQCSNMLFDNLQCLMHLSDAFGKQLTCATLYINIRHGITPFIFACSKLTSLAILAPYFPWHDVSVKSCNAEDLFDLHRNVKGNLPQSFNLLQTLVIKHSYITEDTLKELCYFTNLEILHITLTHDLNMSLLWSNVLPKLTSVKSLFLEVKTLTCLHFEPLPPNLEHLSLKTIGFDRNCQHRHPVEFMSILTQIKTVKIQLHAIAGHEVRTILDSIVSCCPAIEDLTFYVSFCRREITDEQFMSLLCMTSLRQLNLSHEFAISDDFASRLIRELKHLTSLGEDSTKDCESFLPSGPLFWRGLRIKAALWSPYVLYLVGQVKETLQLFEPLPSNLFLKLVGKVAVSLSSQFCSSDQWRLLTLRSSHITDLTLELLDVNCNLSGLPVSVVYLDINCNNEAAGKKEDALLFTSHLPKLEELKIFQKIMNNDQLGATLECVAKLCPKVDSLCIRRVNQDQGPVDEHLTPVFKCIALEWLCFSETFSISDGFGAKLVDKMKNLKHFGCRLEHQLGFDCGPLFIKALAFKASRGEEVALVTKLGKTEIKDMIAPLTLSSEFHVYVPKEAEL